MTGLFGLATLALACWWRYQKCKRPDSRKGYHVGRSRRRRRWQQETAVGVLGFAESSECRALSRLGRPVRAAQSALFP